MARERPLDMVEMHIVKGGEDTGTEAVRAKIESLGIGVLMRVERTCTHGPVVVCMEGCRWAAAEYVAYFRTWNAYGEGARIRQELQGGRTTTVNDLSGQPLWTVTSPPCRLRVLRDERKRRGRAPVVRHPYPTRSDRLRVAERARRALWGAGKSVAALVA